jgi:hypothetical protein
MSRTLISFKDVTIAYLTGGLEGVIAEHQRGASQDTLLRALNELQTNSQPCGDLASYVAEVSGQGEGLETSGNRGRSAPQVGESRTYRAQQVGEADPFVRVPVSLMGVDKGGEVVTTFNPDGTVTLSREG